MSYQNRKDCTFGGEEREDSDKQFRCTDTFRVSQSQSVAPVRRLLGAVSLLCMFVHVLTINFTGCMHIAVALNQSGALTRAMFAWVKRVVSEPTKEKVHFRNLVLTQHVDTTLMHDRRIFMEQLKGVSGLTP